MTDKVQIGIDLLKAGSEAALGTIEESVPFVSAVSYVYETSKDGLGSMMILISDLARHTQNLQKNPNVSLLVNEPGTAPIYERKRVSVQGTAAAVKDPEIFSRLKARYIKAFPSSEGFFNFKDFRFYEILISGMDLISGFGKIETVR